MGIEGLIVFLPVILIALLTLLVRVLLARSKKSRQATKIIKEESQGVQPGSPPKPKPPLPAAATRLSQAEYLYPTPIQIKKLQEAEEPEAEKWKEEEATTHGLISDQIPLRPAQPPGKVEEEKKTARKQPLDRLPPLQRAVIWADILGPPKAER